MRVRLPRCTGVALLLISMLPAASTSCSIYDYTSGVALPVAYEQLVIGSTTKAQALRIVGAPRTVRRQTDGDLFFYGREHNYHTRLLIIPYIPIYDRTRGQISTDRLALFFGPHGILKGIGVEREIPVEEEQ